ncbi:hypothetical protein ACFFHF_16510 [Robertmurraya beringensis]|uniref:Uncharacterized protein n=1 Tax=Robertmurraya beringensis TaxID=641660 RepID=A0ABV6KXU5_9BACI
MLRKIKNGVTDLIKVILLSLVIAVPMYIIGNLFEIEILQWNHREEYNGEYYTHSSALPLILGSAISASVLKKYGKINKN